MKYTEAQLRHQEELSESRKRIQKRKQRTRRLIQFGAIAEALLPGSDKLSPEEFQKLLSSLLSPLGRRNLPTGDEDISQSHNA